MTAESATQPRKIQPLGFYTPSEAARICRVPQWTMNSWRRQGVIVPSVRWVDEEHKPHIGYTFETAVFLRLVRMLREKRVTLLDAVTAMQRLRQRFGPPSTDWAGISIFVYGVGDVYVHREQDEWGTTSLTRQHQRVAELLFGEEFQRLKERADALLVPNEFLDNVEIDPSIQNGLPIILGTAVLTSVVHKLRIRGYEYGEIQNMYPFISDARIAGAEAYESFLDKAALS